MFAPKKAAKRVLWSLGSVILIYVFSPGIEKTVEGVRGGASVGTVGVERAEAQWGSNRRVARRTSRRVSRRYDYAVPAAAVAVAGTAYYEDDDDCYEAVMVAGEVVYMYVDC